MFDIILVGFFLQARRCEEIQSLAFCLESFFITFVAYWELKFKVAAKFLNDTNHILPGMFKLYSLLYPPKPGLESDFKPCFSVFRCDGKLWLALRCRLKTKSCIRGEEGVHKPTTCFQSYKSWFPPPHFCNVHCD